MLSPTISLLAPRSVSKKREALELATVKTASIGEIAALQPTSNIDSAIKSVCTSLLLATETTVDMTEPEFNSAIVGKVIGAICGCKKVNPVNITEAVAALSLASDHYCEVTS